MRIEQWLDLVGYERTLEKIYFKSLSEWKGRIYGANVQRETVPVCGVSEKERSFSESFFCLFVFHYVRQKLKLGELRRLKIISERWNLWQQTQWQVLVAVAYGNIAGRHHLYRLCLTFWRWNTWNRVHYQNALYYGHVTMKRFYTLLNKPTNKQINNIWKVGNRADSQRSEKRPKTHKEIKRTLFSWTKQDKTCKFSRKSSTSKICTFCPVLSS